MKPFALLLLLLAPDFAAAQAGTLTIIHDHAKGYRYFVEPDAPPRTGLRASAATKPRPIEVAKPAFTVKTGDRVERRGTRVLPAPDAQGLRKTVLTLAAPLPSTLGPQQTLMILVNFADNPALRPFDRAAMETMLTDPVDGWSAVFSAMSYGRTTLVGRAVGWYTLPLTNATCDFWAIASAADLAASAAGVNVNAFSRLIYLIPNTPACPWGGLGTVGGTPSRAWLNGYVSALVHEVGHGLALYHSHALRCTDTVSLACTVSEYGDHTDRMGGGGHFNPFQKQRLGWLDAPGMPPITRVATTGIYPVEVYDTPSAAPKALQIARGTTGQMFYVSFRRLVRWESAAGVFVHMARPSDPNSSQLLDMTPGGGVTQSDGNLAVGQTFTDPVSGVRLTTVALAPDRAQIQVVLGGAPPIVPPVVPPPPPPPPPPGDVKLLITGSSPPGREMTWRGTLTGSTTLSATMDGRAIEARYIVVDTARKTWTVKVSGLFKGPHTFAVASGSVTAMQTFQVLK